MYICSDKDSTSLCPGMPTRSTLPYFQVIVNDLTLFANHLKMREFKRTAGTGKAEDILNNGRNQAHLLELIQTIIDSRKTGPQMSVSQHMDSESRDTKVEELSRGS
jgi:hypothetical protein